MSKSNKKVIFILGHGRSGTTLLNIALSAHPNINFINPEFNDLPFFYFNDHLYNKYKSKKYSKILEDFSNHPAIRLKLKLNLTNVKNSKDFIENFFDFYRKKSKKEIIGIKIANKIKENVQMIKSIFKDAYIIHIVRDPRDVFLSLRKTPFGTKSPYYAGKSWKESIEEIQKLKEMKNYLEIKYEDLVKNPETVLKKICNFINIPYSDQMLFFNKNIQKPSSTHRLLTKPFVNNNYNKWKKQLTNHEIRLIYIEASKKMKELSYTNKQHNLKISFIEKLKEYLYDASIFYLKNTIKGKSKLEKTSNI